MIGEETARPVIVSGSPPTPNGDLHLGHLSGPYSGADILARGCRLLGREATYLIGSDYHQSYVPEKARQAGVDATALAKEFDDEIQGLFRAIGFSNPSYLRPYESDLYLPMVRGFFRELAANGHIERRDQQFLFCPTCPRYLVDAYVTGTCPHCGNDDCDGNLCEVCARPNHCVDLVAPRCNHCGSAPEVRTHHRLVFPLARYADRLASFHADAVLAPQLEALCRDMLERGLPDVPISHPADWGIAVPVEACADQRLNVWAEMVPGYFAQLAEALRAGGKDPRSWREVWNAADVVQFFGWDNGFFHALLFPALMMAYDDTLRLPRALLTNEFYRLDDSKFSTSRRHAIWGGALLSVVPADSVRFALAHDRPQFEATSFTFQRFRALVEGELAAVWGSWLDDVFNRLASARSGMVPALAGATRSQIAFVADIRRLAEDCLSAYSIAHFSPRQAARGLCELVWRARDFAAGQSRQRARGPAAPEAATALAAEATAVKHLAQLSYPIMPEFSRRLWAALGYRGEPRWDGGTPVPAGQRIAAPGNPFFQALPADLETATVRP
ncbi:methionine--tRNA ligase [Amycolatopsis anabasis]|uniref:methionine--tRNA ligase n=1 Tax=Amycolatopsis anabasis TaxID=1840409 RepID=UPI00131DC6CB|nr:class I tRNA ligase family protein [Amycolatopsis anabasis]